MSWRLDGFAASLTSVSDSTRDAYLHDIAATLRFDLGPAWILKLEGHFLRGTAELDPKLNEGKTPAMMEKDWGLFLAKTTVYF